MTAAPQNNLPEGTVIRVTTGDGMSYGPHAVARKDGKVIFIRGGAPQEEADVVVREDRASFAYADVQSILRPSTARRSAPCPYLPQCGGCPWQHLEYEAQLEAKRTIVREQLRRIGKLDTEVQPVIASPREYGYRQRLKLRVADREVGFFAGASHSLVAVDHCLLPEPTVAAAMPAAQALVKGAQTQLSRLEMTATGESEPRVVVVAQAAGDWNQQDKVFCKTWLHEHPQVGGLTITGRRWRREWGEGQLTIRPESNLELRVRAGSFIQVNPEGNELLVATVLNFIDPTPGKRVLDLYAGAGNFSLPLARRGVSVLAVERDRRAAEDAAVNAQRLGMESCRVQQGNVSTALDQLVGSNEQFDAVILDPPRDGAAETIDALTRLAPPRLVYASCDPATLARDLGRLASRYRIERVQPIDLFPHTYHIETVVQASLTRP